MSLRACAAVAAVISLIVAAQVDAAGEKAAESTPAGAKTRQKIGLVLGGGGALGLAHIGVLQALEEQRIPIDCIGGTSMGSIIAGLYASGLAPDEIADVMISLDWWDVMKDQTPYRDLDFRRKEDSSRYLMDLELGLRGFRVLFPHGLASGQKFNNLMQSLTVNAAGVSSFDKLNIPFRAIATDLRSGEAVVLDRGNLATAMRASMAVPGVFTPVALDGKLLVDGGLANNIPVDVVKAMGADVIIAVDVGASEAKAGQRSEFNSLGDIISRTYAIMQRPKDDARRKAADLLIEPDLGALAASDFHRASELIPCGRRSVEVLTNELGRLSVAAKEYAAWRDTQRAKRAVEMTIRSVEITGNRKVSTAMIMKRVETKPGDKVDFGPLHNDVARVHGMGDFLTVTHRLVPTGRPGEYDLKIDTVEKYWGQNYVHCGMRLESDLNGATSYSVLLNMRQANMNSLGGESRVDLEFGRSQRAFLELYQPLQDRGFLFVAPAVEMGTELVDFYRDGDRVAEYRKDKYDARVDVGVQYKEYGEFRVGVLSGTMKARPEIGDSDLPTVEPRLGAITAQLVVDRMDARVFARHGSYLRLNGYFSNDALGADDEYSKLEGVARWVWSTGNHTVGVGLMSGYSFGDDVPVYDQFAIGGMTTIPGFAPGELRGSFYDVASMNYRYRIGQLSPSMGKGTYILAGVSAGNVWQSSGEIEVGDVIFGGSVGIAMDTLMGPIIIGAGEAEGGGKQLYMTVGTLF